MNNQNEKKRVRITDRNGVSLKKLLRSLVASHNCVSYYNEMGERRVLSSSEVKHLAIFAGYGFELDFIKSGDRLCAIVDGKELPIVIGAAHFPVLDKNNIERQQFAVDLQMGG